MGFVIGIDVGGTHSDIVATDGYVMKTAKVQTTSDPTDGVTEGLEMIAQAYEMSLEKLLANCDRFIYGSTTATNMFISRKLPKLGLLATMGHRDVLWYRDGYKPDRWNLRMPPLWTLTPRYLRQTVEERVNYRGEVLVPLSEQNVRQAVEHLKKQGIEALSICFLWSFLHPEHERRAKEIAERILGPEIPVVISCDVLPTIQEWERTFCTTLSAGIVKAVGAHLKRLRDVLKARGFKRELLIMQCSGGCAGIDAILKVPIYMVASGPAGAPLAGVFYGQMNGFNDILTLDMGGTSFDVCIIPDRKIDLTKYKRLENEPIAVPSVDVHTIGAGGGSISWIDPGGALRVGPNSAGSIPGPACYGKGGEEPTVTDAYLVLNYINPDYFLGGRTKLNPALAEKSIREKIAEPLGMDVVAAATRIVEITNSQMAEAMRLVSIQRGIDPRPFTVVVGGGAGPVQATRLAEELGVRSVFVPRAPGVLSALGMISANLKHERLGAFNAPANNADLDALSGVYKDMEASLMEQFKAEGIPEKQVEYRRFVDTRYVGQIYELDTEIPRFEKYDPLHLEVIIKKFEEDHETLYHYRMPGFAVEFMSCRVEGIGKITPLQLEETPDAGPDPSTALKERRPVYLPGKGDFVEVNIYDGDRLQFGNMIEGVAIVETKGSTLGIWENQKLVVNKYGDFEITIK